MQLQRDVKGDVNTSNDENDGRFHATFKGFSVAF